MYMVQKGLGNSGHKIVVSKVFLRRDFIVFTLSDTWKFHTCIFSVI